MKTKQILILFSFLLSACGSIGVASSSSFSSSSKSQESSQNESSTNPNSETLDRSSSVISDESGISIIESSSSSIVAEEASSSESESSSKEMESSGETSESVSTIEDTEEGYHEGVAKVLDPVSEAYPANPAMSNTLPKIYFDDPEGSFDWATKPNRTHKWDYTNMGVTLVDGEETLLDNVEAGVKVRGNYTSDYAKKPFRIKFSKKQSMLGLNGGKKFKSWVLLADRKDPSFSRNATAFYLGRNIMGSDGYYCTDFRPVELYINKTFWGCYLLAEQQQVGKGRIEISEPEKDYTGTDIGYLFEYDIYHSQEPSVADGGDYTFTITYHDDGPLQTYSGKTVREARDDLFYFGRIMNGFTIKSDIYDQSQVDFLRNYVENVYNLMYEAVYNNNLQAFNEDYTGLIPSSATSVKECIEEAVDVDSLVDTYIQQEITCDTDIAHSSFYMDVDFSETGEKKLRFEAPWDYDSALAMKKEAGDGKSLYAAESENAWLILLQKQDWFHEKVLQKWQQIVKNNILQNSLHYIDFYRIHYNDRYEADLSKWGVSEGSNEWRSALARVYDQETHSNYLYNWLGGRYNYLNSIWGDGSEIAKVEELPDSQGGGDNPWNPWPWNPGGGDNPPSGETKSFLEMDYSSFLSTRIEMEDVTRSGGGQVKTDDSASSGRYVSEINPNPNISFEIEIPEDDSDYYLVLGLSKRATSSSLSNWFEFRIDNEAYTPLSISIPAISGSEREFHAWTEVPIGGFHHKDKGKLTITSRNQSTNLDYLDIYYPAK